MSNQRELNAAENADCVSLDDTVMDSWRQQELRALLHQLKTESLSRKVYSERRRQTRYPFPAPVHITPYNEKGELVNHQTLTVMVKDISRGGTAFLHANRLESKNLMVSFLDPDGNPLKIRAAVVYVKEIRENVFLHGCEFLERLEADLANAGIGPANA